MLSRCISYFWRVLVIVTAYSRPTAAAEAMEFSQALQTIVDASTERAKSELNSQAAQAQLRQARQLYLPSLDAIAGLRRSGEFTGEHSDSQLLEARASLNIYRFGADQAAQTSAIAGERATQLENQAQLIDMDHLAANALLGVIAVTQSLAIEERFLAMKGSSLDLTRRLFERGQRPQQDVEKLAIDVAGEEVRVRELKIKQMQAQAELTLIAGRPLTVTPQWPWQSLLANSDESRLARLSSSDERLDIQALNEKLAAADAKISQARSQMYPSLDFGAAYQWRRRLDDQLIAKTWDLTLTLNVPLYSRGTDYYGYTSQVIAKRVLELDLQTARQTANTNREAAIQTLRVSLEGVKARESIRKRAQVLYDQSLNAFQKGVLSVNDLTADQSRLLQTEFDTVDAWVAVHRALTKLCAALGERLQACVAKLE